MFLTDSYSLRLADVEKNPVLGSVFRVRFIRELEWVVQTVARQRRVETDRDAVDMQKCLRTTQQTR